MAIAEAEKHISSRIAICDSQIANLLQAQRETTDFRLKNHFSSDRAAYEMVKKELQEVLRLLQQQ